VPTTPPARAELRSLAERPAVPGALAEAFALTTAAGAGLVLGLTALVTTVAGPLPFALPLWEVIGRAAFFTGLAFGALAIGETTSWRAGRASQPLSIRRRHPATWATIGLAAFVVAGVLRGGRDAHGEFHRAEIATTPLGVAEARARARPDDPLSQFSLGVAYARAERFADADAPLRRAVQLAPHAGIVHEWYAWTRSRLGDYGQALSEYRLAAANHDANPSVDEGLARNLIMTGSAREAELIVRRRLATNANDALWQNLLGWSLERQPGRTAEAIKAFETALVYDHEDPWTEAMLGYTYRSKADFRTATTHFERAYALRPSVLIGYELGATRMLACDVAGAAAAFAATDAQFPNATDAVPAEYRRLRANLDALVRLPQARARRSSSRRIASSSASPPSPEANEHATTCDASPIPHPNSGQ
jgi:tetratricopeptide (TPR) repeat protein